MKEYPFSSINSEKALEYLWQEFREYKAITDKKIAMLENQLADVNEKFQELQQVQTILLSSPTNIKAEKLNAMFEKEENINKTKNYASKI